MLQQTRVETVIPYFERWMKTFPTIEKLAKASEQDVLNAWEDWLLRGARNLYKAAKIVLEEHNGKLSRNLDELRALPGIAVILQVQLRRWLLVWTNPLLMENLRRVFTRVFDISEPADSSAGEKKIMGLTAKYLPKGQLANTISINGFGCNDLHTQESTLYDMSTNEVM